MGNKFQLHRWLTELRELYHYKCVEVKQLKQSKKYPLKIIELRQREADKLKELLDGLTKVNPMDLIKLQIYSTFHENLTKLVNDDPDLLGCAIIIGADKSENYQRFSRITWNIPISFFRS